MAFSRNSRNRVPSHPAQPPPASSSAAREERPRRPSNSFICFRSSKEWRQIERAIKGRKAKSVTAGQVWGNLSPEERAVFEEMAAEKKRQHKERYPNYKYNPQPKTGKRKKKRKQAQDTGTSISAITATANNSGDQPSATMAFGSSSEVVGDAVEEDVELIPIDTTQTLSDLSLSVTSPSFCPPETDFFQDLFYAFDDHLSAP